MSDNTYTHIDPEQINNLGDDDPEFVRDIINDALELMPDSIELLESAIDKADSKEIAFQAHKLKGTFRFLGNKDIGNILEQIEKHPDSATEELALKMKEVKTGYHYMTQELQDYLSKL